MDEGMKLFTKKKDLEDLESEFRSAQAVVKGSESAGADVTSARLLLETARKKIEAGRLEEAREIVAKTKKHARLLERRYVEARKNIAELFQRVKKLKEMGIDTYEFEVLLVKARKRMEDTIRENDVDVPNYAGANRIATRASKIALKHMREQEAASNAVFVARMILDNAMKSMVYVEETTLREKVFAGVTKRLKEAEDLMKAGNTKEAYGRSSEAEKEVEKLKKDYEEAVEAYKSAEKSLMEGKERGIRPSDLAKTHRAAGQALIDGSFEAARRKSLEVYSEMKSLEDRKGRAKDTIENAENAVEAAKSTGFDANEAQRFLEEAKWAFERGIYQRAINCGEDALRKASKISSIHLKVSQDLESTKKKVRILRNLGIEISNELEEVIEKAEKDLLLGDYVNSNEELMIARVLIGTLERKHHDMLPEIDRNLEAV